MSDAPNPRPESQSLSWFLCLQLSLLQSSLHVSPREQRTSLILGSAASVCSGAPSSPEGWNLNFSLGKKKKKKSDVALTCASACLTRELLVPKLAMALCIFKDCSSCFLYLECPFFFWVEKLLPLPRLPPSKPKVQRSSRSQMLPASPSADPQGALSPGHGAVMAGLCSFTSGCSVPSTDPNPNP